MAKKKRKYAFGGNTDPLADRLLLEYSKGLKPNTVQTPEQALMENNIALAKAENKAQNNPWTQGLDLLGNLAIQIGSSMATSGASKGLSNGFKKAAYGGTVGSNVEVEGQEVGQLPNGSLIDFEGPSHEQGGIDVSLPSGTDIYSKRIKVDNKTLAERKKIRERKINRARKTLEKNPHDVLAKNTIQRLTEVNEMEEAFDTNLQDVVSASENPDKFAYGGTTGIDPIDISLLKQLYEVKDILGESGKTSIPTIGNTNDNSTISLPVKSVNPSDLDNPMDKTIQMSSVPKEGGEGDGSGVELGAGMPTVGDLVGMAGNLYQAFKPRSLTLENRGGDTPNVNSYRDFGKDGLKTIQGAKQKVQELTNEAKRDLQLNRNAIAKRNRNSARGVNTLRALDITADNMLNQSEADVNARAAAQLLNLISQEAQMQNTQDQVVMGGEAQRDLADRQDRDNFYTQLAKDEVAVGQGVSRTGKAMNQIKERGVNENMINSLADYLQINTRTGVISAKQAKQIETAEKNKTYIKKGWSKKDWEKLTPEQKLMILKTK